MIPRLLHQLWIGPRAVPSFTRSWQEYARNYGWVYRLWREADIEELGLKWRDIYEAVGEFQIRSDIARIEILSRFGGFYFDCDIASSGVSLSNFIPLDHTTIVGTPEHNLNPHWMENRHRLCVHDDFSSQALFICSGWLGCSLESKTIARTHASFGRAYQRCPPAIAGTGFGPYVLNASICEPVLVIPNGFTTNHPAPSWQHLSHTERYEDT